MFSTISSTNPRVFINTPTEADSLQFKPVILAPSEQPINFAAMAVRSVTHRTRPKEGGREGGREG
jgi:hypothetical protein